MQRYIIFHLVCLIWLAAAGADPTDTRYTFAQCEGSAMPYPAPEQPTATPDSLTPIFVNHIGRHGARFQSSQQVVVPVLKALNEADSAKALSDAGRKLLTLTKFIAETSRNRWGALDSLGMAEQRGIASRMFRTFGPLFIGSKVNAISSYSPRCVMSMYEFTHQLDRLNNNVEIFTSAGRQNSPLVRFFDLDPEYTQWLRNGDWRQAYDMQFSTAMPSAPARKLFKADYGAALSNEQAQELTYHIFHLLQGLSAMGLPSRMQDFFTLDEANAAWSCTNLRHYLQRTLTTISQTPAELAAPLLVDLIEQANLAADGKQPYCAVLRFGHAETLMPLLSLMRLKGCYYLTNYFDTTALHWRDFAIVPMAANLQIILFRTKAGKVYARFDLNEQPVALFPDSPDIYIPWQDAREYLLRCVPLHLRP